MGLNYIPYSFQVLHFRGSHLASNTNTHNVGESEIRRVYIGLQGMRVDY